MLHYQVLKNKFSTTWNNVLSPHVLMLTNEQTISFLKAENKGTDRNVYVLVYRFEPTFFCPDFLKRY
jgi:hypothetical protein